MNWFEIPVEDFERAKIFYSKILDFDMPTMNMDQITKGILLYDQPGGGAGGAITTGPGTKPASDTGIRIYLNSGKNLETILNRVESAGGKIIQHKFKINDEIGHIAVFQDTEGNQIGLHSHE